MVSHALFRRTLALATAALLCASALARDSDLSLYIDRLKHPLPEARRDAAATLSDYGVDGAEAVPALVAALDDPEAEVRRAVVTALAATKSESRAAIDGLMLALSDDDWVVRRLAAEAFEDIDDAAAVVSLGKLLATGDTPSQIAAAVALGKFGPGARQALPELIAALRSPDWKLRGAAARAIGRLGRDAGPDGIAALGDALRDRDWGVAEPVVEALARIGAPAVPVLVDALADAAVPVRWGAVRALGRIGPEAAPAVDAIASRLDDPVMQVRWAAARALLDIGPAAASAEEALSAAMQDEAWVVRWSAARALGETASGDIGEHRVAALATALADPDSRVCEAAAFGLESLGPRAIDALPALQQATRHGLDTGAAGRCEVIDVGPAAEQVLIDSGWTVRWTSVRALGVVGAGAPDIVDTLVDASNDEIWQVRGVATLALGHFTPTPAIIEALSVRLRDEAASVRKAAVVAAAEAGGTAAVALVELAVNDTDEDVRRAAIDALKKLRNGG